LSFSEVVITTSLLGFRLTTKRFPATIYNTYVISIEDCFMLWEIELYESASGNQPVADFIAALKPGEQAKIARAIDLLKEYGPSIGMPYVRHMADDLWELRVPFGGQAFRLLFFISGNTLVVVHAFSKKTSKAPQKELKTALARMKDYKQRTGGFK